MKRLSGIDATLLYCETPNLHSHTLKVAVVWDADASGEFNFEAFRQTFERRLHLLEPLRYKLVETPWRLHHPMWLEGCDIDLDYHLRRVAVPSPGGRRELDQVISAVASIPLDRSRPLWEFHFAEGLADGRFALIGKVHHSLADGVASANLLGHLIGLVALAEDQHDDVAGRSVTRRGLLLAAGRDHTKQVLAMPGLVTDVVRGVARLGRNSRLRADYQDVAARRGAPKTFLNHVVSPQRTFATAALSLAQVKETAKRLGVKLNDVVLALASGALRELLLRYDGCADKPIIATMPVGTDTSSDRLSGNAISALTVSLPVHVDDPLERVRLVVVSATRAKEDHELLGPTMQARILEYLPPLASVVFRWQSRRVSHPKSLNVAVSNVMGPREQGDIGGAAVTEIYSVGILQPGSAFNVTVWSYVDQLGVSVLSDDQTFRDVHEATDAITHAFVELRLAAGLSADLVGVEGVMGPAHPFG